MLLRVLGHLLGRALCVALRRGTLGCPWLLLFLDVLLVFTLLMSSLRCCNMQWRYILLKKCRA